MADRDPDPTDGTDAPDGTNTPRGTDVEDATSATNATDVFDRVTHSTRVNVLRALASAHATDPTDPWLQYNELRDAVDVRDNGNFNYHLDELADFVVKTDAGYRLSRAGMELVSTIASGVLDTDYTWGPVDAPGTCPFCDDDVVLHYTDGKLHLTCGTPDHAMPLGAPPSLLETHPESDVVDKVALLEYQWSETTRQGVCTDCHGEHRLHSRDTRWNKRTGELLRPLDPTMPKGADQNHHDGVFVPEHTKLLSAGKPVKSSSSRLISGCLQAVTDGVIRADNGPQLTLPRGKQWIEIDLGKKARIHAVMVWHAPGSDRSYRDVIVQLSPNRNFGQKARTIFNNDIDNSSGVGRGLDPEWTEGPNGKLIEAGGLKARYVRLYSSGNSDNDRNHYTEVRVYGTTRLPQRDSEN